MPRSEVEHGAEADLHCFHDPLADGTQVVGEADSGKCAELAEDDARGLRRRAVRRRAPATLRAPQAVVRLLTELGERAPAA
ncbi:hypothetical protein [Streptomyces bicolor]|uniref:hypothetical protein n=1 Tax=Streptomyces bicolor TaxID=66874 RepID=UPI00131B3DA8|nr:hypothetical protein [Streptomyces bicolor]